MWYRKRQKNWRTVSQWLSVLYGWLQINVTILNKGLVFFAAEGPHYFVTVSCPRCLTNNLEAPRTLFSLIDRIAVKEIRDNLS